MVCLNEESGLLEWVPNTSGFRHELSAVYTANGHEQPMSLCAKLREPFETMQRKYAVDGKVCNALMWLLCTGLCEFVG